LTLAPLEAPQPKYDLREVWSALRWMVRTGAQWAYLLHDFPPPEIVQAQVHRWMQRGVFEDLVHDLRRLQGKAAQPSAALYDARTLPSTPQSGERAGYDGHKRRKGSNGHAAVDTLGHLLALVVTAADEQERAQVAELSRQVQEVSGRRVEVAFVDQGYTGEAAAEAARAAGIELRVVKVEGAKRGFVLLPKRWVVDDPLSGRCKHRAPCGAFVGLDVAFSQAG